MQLTLVETADDPVVEGQRSTDVDNLTPMDALELLAEWGGRL